MAAETRWVEYSTTAAASTYIGATTSGVGTRGRIEADTVVGDNFSIGSTNSMLKLCMDGVGGYSEIALTSGTALDARFVARDITEKMHALEPNVDSWKYSTCGWINNRFIIYSGNIGGNSSVALLSGTNTAIDILGFTTSSTTQGAGGSYENNTYNGGITISGTWEGMFDETYTILIDKVLTIDSVTPGGNTYNGTFSTGGQYNADKSDPTYVVTISTTNGSMAGGGTGHVPKFSWTSTDSFDVSAVDVEILYPDHWYNVGVHGIKVKWSDAVFGDGDDWTIVCKKPSEAYGAQGDAPVGQALYIWTSERGDECSSAITTSSTSWTRVGTRGLFIKFVGGSTNLYAGDEFRVVCTAPQPTSYGITSLNYGNVTVTTESAVKCVLFEIMSGAVMMNSVKFGLQNEGSFSYHGTGETCFRYGEIGAKDTAGADLINGKEWRTNVIPTDMTGATPNYLAHTKADLAEVASADDSEAVGNYQSGLVSDFIFLCIKLGADETGSNSSINLRLFFDYS